MTRRLILLSLFASLLLPQLATATDYYVSTNGDDDDDGLSWETAWQTASKLSSINFEPGDTATFADGTYDGCITLNWHDRGTAQSPVTIKSLNRHMAILKGGASPMQGKNWVVYVADGYSPPEYLIIDGFRMVPYDLRPTTLSGWLYMSNARYCTIRDCQMEDATYWWPVWVTYSSYNRFENLNVWRSLYRDTDGGGTAEHAHGNLCFLSGTSSRNLFECVHFRECGHTPIGVADTCSYTVFRNCLFDSRWARAFDVFSTDRVLMEGCTVTNSFDGTHAASGASNALFKNSIIRNNLFYRNADIPLRMCTFINTDPDPDVEYEVTNSRIHNNTVVLNHRAVFDMQEYASSQGLTIGGNVFQNNLFAYNDLDGDGLVARIHPEVNQSGINILRYNNVFGYAPGCYVIWYAADWSRSIGSHGYTVAQIETAYPSYFYDNLDVEPDFVDMDEDDYRLDTGSDCIDAGAVLTTTIGNGSGTQISVDDARWFYDGFGIPGEQGDLIWVGTPPKHAAVRVVGVNTGGWPDAITVDQSITWKSNDPISLPYTGSAPDLGAYEYDAEEEDWYAAPELPDGLTMEDLRIETMETANQRVIRTTFEEADWLDWCYLWDFNDDPKTEAIMDSSTAGQGSRSMNVQVKSSQSGADLKCYIAPRWWNIDRFPIVRFYYRLPYAAQPQDEVPVGMWVKAFASEVVGEGWVYLGGTATAESGGVPALSSPYDLVADGQWHELVLDVTDILDVLVETQGGYETVYEDVEHLQLFKFGTEGNAASGDEFWFDDFRIDMQ